MAMPLGTENKKQVYILIALSVLLVCAAGYAIKNTFGGSSAPPAVTVPRLSNIPPASANGSAAEPAGSAGQEAQKLSNAGIDPTLHLDKLALTEDVEYEGTGRNIFSAESAPEPARIEPLAAGPRPGQPGVNAAPSAPAIPKPPAIDLKYFGYAQSKGKSMEAFFVHGEDVFVAHSGEVVDHRYKVGDILPTKVQVTDLGYNNTQFLTFQPN